MLIFFYCGSTLSFHRCRYTLFEHRTSLSLVACASTLGPGGQVGDDRLCLVSLCNFKFSLSSTNHWRADYLLLSVGKVACMVSPNSSLPAAALGCTCKGIQDTHVCVCLTLYPLGLWQRLCAHTHILFSALSRILRVLMSKVLYCDTCPVERRTPPCVIPITNDPNTAQRHSHLHLPFDDVTSRYKSTAIHVFYAPVHLL